MKSILTAIFVIISFFTYAQTNDKCLTAEMDTTAFENLPWYDNNDYLENYLDSIGYPTSNVSNRIVGLPVRYWVPVKFWVYRNSLGIGGPDARQIRLLMDDLIRRYNQTNNTMIGFYLKCAITFVNNDEHLVKTQADKNLLSNSSYTNTNYIYIYSNLISA